MRVALLGGGRSSEHDVSLCLGRRMAEGLRRGRPRSRGGAARAGRALEARRRAGGARAGAAGCSEPTSCSPCCTGPSARTAPSRGCSSSLDVPYVGAGVLGSALSHGQGGVQGPDGARRGAAGGVAACARARRRGSAERSVCRSFVKPARLGSSVGISKAWAGRARRRRSRSPSAHDPLVIVEALRRGIEVECSVLGDERPGGVPARARSCPRPSGTTTRPSTADGGMELVVPAPVPDAVRERGARAGGGGLRAIGLLGAGAGGLLRGGRRACS